MKCLRLLSFILALMMIFSISACGDTKDTGGDNNSVVDNNTTNNNTDTDKTDATPEPTATPEFVPDLKGRAIIVGAGWELKDPERGKTVLGDEKADLFDAIKTKYNFTFEYATQEFGAFFQTIQASALAGDPISDITWVMNHWFYPSLVSKGLLYPLSDIEYLDFNQKKYDQFTFNNTVYKGKVYGMSNEVQQPRALYFFNKQHLDAAGLEYPYEKQKNMQWTWDALLEYTQALTSDKDNDGVTDQWGMFGTEHAEASFVFSNNGSFVVMDEKGKPKFAMQDENVYEAFNFMRDLRLKYQVWGNPGSWGAQAKGFGAGNASFFGAEMWVKSNFSEMQDYGILIPPMGPKMSDYVSPASEFGFVSIINGVKDPDLVGFVYDKMIDWTPSMDDDWWISGQEGNIRDTESIDTLRLLTEKMVLNLGRSIGPFNNTYWSILGISGSEAQSVVAAIDSVAESSQSLLDDIIADAESE